MVRVRFTHSATLQIRSAQTLYEERRNGLGKQFAVRIQSAIDRVSNQPEGAPDLYEGVRRVVIRRFPYSLFYLYEGDEIIVIGFHHQSESPGSWPDPSQV